MLTITDLAALTTYISNVHYGFLLHSQRARMKTLLPLGSVISGFRAADDVLVLAGE